MAVVFDPFREMDRLASQLMGGSSAARTPRWMPMDLYRAGDHYVVNIDLPGVDPGSIDVDVDGTTLTVRAERTLRGEENAEWIAAQFRTWGYDTRIETFHVLFPTPLTRVLELVAPTRFQARLSEPALREDATSGQAREQLPV